MLDKSSEVVYYLVARTNANIANKGLYRLAAATTNPNTIPMIWLANTLHRELDSDINEYFNMVEKFENESAALLSVFFGKNDYSLVLKGTYDTMVELNPQISAKTKIVF